MDKLAIAAAGRVWLAQQLRLAEVDVIIPSSSKTNLSVKLGNGKKIEFQILASSGASFKVRKSIMEKPGSLVVYIWNVADPEKCIGYAMMPKEALAFVEQEGYTQRSTWVIYRETGTITIDEKVQNWLEQHRLTPTILKQKIDSVYSPETKMSNT